MRVPIKFPQKLFYTAFPHNKKHGDQTLRAVWSPCFYFRRTERDFKNAITYHLANHLFSVSVDVNAMLHGLVQLSSLKVVIDVGRSGRRSVDIVNGR